MASLNYPPFANNARISLANNDTNRPIAIGEPDREAVRILQQALIDVGIPLKDGADGLFGPLTAAAVRAAEIKYNLSLDSGRAGPQVIGSLDQALGQPGPVPPPAKPQFGRTVTLLIEAVDGTFTNFWRADFANSARLLGEYGIELRVIHKEMVPLKADPVVPYDPITPTQLRQACEKSVPGEVNAYRCIFSQITDQTFCANTYALGAGELLDFDIDFRMNPFTVFNYLNPCADRVGLVHEMIHATGLHDHDPNPKSVFYADSPRSTDVDKFRTVLKEEHAKRIAEFFASSKT